MKINIRKNVFETNSSSSHSLVVATKEQKEGFEKGLLWFNVTHAWKTKDFLKDPETGERLPAFVNQEVADKVFKAEREAKEKNYYLGEELIHINCTSSFLDWSYGIHSPFEKMEAEEREDGKYDLHIYHFFG